MVGEDEAVGGNERTRAAADAHGGQAQVIEELVADGDAVLLLDLVLGEVVEEPHPLIGQQGQSEGAEQYESHGGVRNAIVPPPRGGASFSLRRASARLSLSFPNFEHSA